MVMWFIKRDVLGYICDNSKSQEKRIKFIKSNKDIVINEIKKLESEELIKLLFNSKVLKEFKKIICEYINDVSKKYGSDSAKRVMSLKEAFNEIGHYSQKYILSDTCPDIFKVETISHLYTEKPYDMVKNKKVSKKIKKVILKSCLTSEQLVRLLCRKIPDYLKLYIIDECLDDKYELKMVLYNDKVDDRYKERIFETRITNEELFSFLDNSDGSVIEYVLNLKDKEFNSRKG